MIGYDDAHFFDFRVFTLNSLILLLNAYFFALIFVLTLRYPYGTGSSVVATKYKDGILMATDMGGLIFNLVFVFVLNCS